MENWIFKNKMADSCTKQSKIQVEFDQLRQNWKVKFPSSDKSSENAVINTVIFLSTWWISWRYHDVLLLNCFPRLISNQRGMKETLTIKMIQHQLKYYGQFVDYLVHFHYENLELYQLFLYSNFDSS